MTANEDIRLRTVERSEIMLSESDMTQLQDRTILAFFGGSGVPPVTFVKMRDGIV